MFRAARARHSKPTPEPAIAATRMDGEQVRNTTIFAELSALAGWQQTSVWWTESAVYRTRLSEIASSPIEPFGPVRPKTGMAEPLMITRLSVDDATVLRTQTPATPAHTVAVVVLDASEHLSHARLHDLVASSLPQLARFRSRLVRKPLGIGQPVWAEIDDYDPAPHIVRASAPAPGGQRELADLVAQLSAETQDWRRSLWKAWTIDGLAGSRWAVAVKMSRILTDGDDGVAAVFNRLLTSGPNDPPDAHPAEASLGPVPSLGELITDTVGEIVENQVTGAWLLAEAVARTLTAVRHRTRVPDVPPVDPTATTSMSGPVPDTPFNAPLTQRRSMAFASIPLTDVKTVSDAFGGSTANVFLAACTLSLRAWLQRNEVIPDNPLVMEVPLSVPADDPAETRKPLGVGQVRVPVQLSDPVQVLTNLHTAGERMNIVHDFGDEDANQAVDAAAVLALLPPSITRVGMKVYTRLRLPQPPVASCQGIVSFMSDGPTRAYCAGALVVGTYVSKPLVERCGLNITVTSHGDVMDVCVCVCPDSVPRVDEIAAGIVEAVDTLVAAAAESPRGKGRSVVSEMTSHTTKRSRAR